MIAASPEANVIECRSLDKKSIMPAGNALFAMFGS